MGEKKDSKIIQLMLIMGSLSVCEGFLQNIDVKWISWGYSSEYVHPDVINHIKDKLIKPKTEVVFAVWNLGVEKRAKIIRKGMIDHIVFKGGYVNFTIFLKEAVLGFIELSRTDHYLCRYVNLRREILC